MTCIHAWCAEGLKPKDFSTVCPSSGTLTSPLNSQFSHVDLLTPPHRRLPYVGPVNTVERSVLQHRLADGSVLVHRQRHQNDDLPSCASAIPYLHTYVDYSTDKFCDCSWPIFILDWARQHSRLDLDPPSTIQCFKSMWRRGGGHPQQAVEADPSRAYLSLFSSSAPMERSDPWPHILVRIQPIGVMDQHRHHGCDVDLQRGPLIFPLAW
jgi:hypothetical protein